MDLTSSDNYSAWISPSSFQDWFHPTDIFYNDSTPALTLTLLPKAGPFNTTNANSLIPLITLPPLATQSLSRYQLGTPAGSHESASFGRFRPAPVLSTVPPSLPAPRLLTQPALPHPQLTKDTIHKLLEMGTSQLFFILFQHRSLTAVVFAGYHAFKCLLCDSHVNTSIPGTVLLTSGGQFNTLMNHYCKKPYQMALAWKEKKGANTVLQGMNTSIPPSSVSFPSTPVSSFNSKGTVTPLDQTNW